MQFYVTIFLGILTVCRSAFGVPLFGGGQEFKYKYETLVTAGSEQPISYASAYKLKGTLVVSAVTVTSVNVKLQDLTVGLYNGKWSYFPIPEMTYFATPNLAPLEEPFQMTVENGKAKSILLDDQEPEWASNMKRGLATYLQMDLENVTFRDIELLNRKELTTMGECQTRYEILPSSTTLTRLTRVNKFRNHADCPDVPRRTRYATHIFYPCTDQYTRDIMNSTAYSTYEMEVGLNGQPLLKQLTLFSSVLYWPFTGSGPYQFSWVNMTLSLESVAPLASQVFPTPPNSETHEDLSYIFEQSDPTVDPEDENIELTNEVLLFHHLAVDDDPETYRKTVDMTKALIRETAESLVNTESFFSDWKRFHSNSPSSIMFLVASLDYAHLSGLYLEYESTSSSNFGKLTELQLFLDGLILAGTTPATLVIRDVIVSSSNEGILGRLAPALPHFIRNPTEALAKEMDILLTFVDNPKISSSIRRTVAFSLASLIGRCCRKTLCTSSGLLDKYIKYFEDKLMGSTDFDERTVGLLGLRNLRYGKALDKVLDIAAGKSAADDRPLRVQAVWSLRNLFYQDPDRLTGNILPVFFNRSEPCELRSTVLSFVMSLGPNTKLLHDLAYFMWTETCPMVGNIMRSSLINAMNTKSPCGNTLKTYARTILQYLPPGEVDPLKSTAYQIDYYDRTHGFGHQIYATVHKSGETALPVSIYLGFNNYIGGFASSYFGVFIRMEGVEKSVANKLAAIRSADVSKIKDIFSKIGVSSRPNSPLYLELTVVYHDYTVLHFAVDDRTLHKIPEYLKSLGALSKDASSLNWERSVMIGGIFQEFPLEIGTPVSVTAGLTGIGSFTSNVTQSGSLVEAKSKLQFNLFGTSRISNHAPGLGTMHSMTSQRGLRLVLPTYFGLDVQRSASNFFVEPPTLNNPLIAMAHGTSFTSLHFDSITRVKEDVALTLLRKSCAHCGQDEVISRGYEYRKTRRIPVQHQAFLRGLISDIKYFDCERDHSTTALLKKFGNFFHGESQNAGLFDSPVTKLLLSLSHARDLIFAAPFAETCGIYARIAQNETASFKFERAQVVMAGGIDLRDSNGQENLKLKTSSEVTFKFSGETPGNTKFLANLEVNDRSIETQAISLKIQKLSEPVGEHKVVCVKIDSSASRLPKDLLSYENENEPNAEQRVKVMWGKVTGNQVDPPCSDNLGSFDLWAKSSRSNEQKEAAASNEFPYGSCKVDKASSDYPGSFVPPSASCQAAAFEQTILRQMNVTVNYKISEEIEVKLRPVKSLIFGLGLMYPSTSEPGDSGRFSHSAQVHSSQPGQKYVEGQIDLDLNLDNASPSADFHFHDISLNKEEHYHGVDLSPVPKFLRPRPVRSRMSPWWTIGFLTGAVGHCSITPSLVNTLDSFSYSAPLSDCWTLLSGDCGTSTQFAILGKKISPTKISIRVHFGDSTVEFGEDLKPIIDGTKVTLENKKIYIREGPTPISFDVFRNGDEGYVVSKVLGAYIRYTGYFVTVTLDSRYRGNHCGLCGHWDSSLYNDLIGPDTRCLSLIRPADMPKVYVVKEGNCGVAGSQCGAPP